LHGAMWRNGPGESYSFNMAQIQTTYVQRSRGWAASGIAAFVLALGIASAFVPGSEVSIHNVLHHLNFLPLMMAGILFGVRGAAATAVLSAVVDAPLIAHQWKIWPLDAKDQIVELGIFAMAGLIAGYLSDQESAQRAILEETRNKLEAVYQELSDNVARMKQAERLSAIGRLSANLAHEIRNPLASISGAAGILTRGAAPQEYLEDSLEIIQKESQRLNKLLTGFLNFAKPREPRLQRTDPGALLDSVASLISNVARENQICVVCETREDSAEIACDPEQIRQVLLNLVLNAIEASAPGGSVRLRSVCEADRVLLQVQDSGAGISEDVAGKIFEPFFTTKAKGTGLGLAISSAIITQHGGSLSFRNNVRGGTTFSIELPAGREVSSGS